MSKKKVLIICYYWPPAGGPGVQRWLKFVKYLPEFNIEPIVYCPENPSYPLVDDSLLTEVSDDILILKQPIKEINKWASRISKRSDTIRKGIIPVDKKQSWIEKILLFIRGNFFIPDARVTWVKPSVKYLSQYIEEQKIDTIISTGPPHSMHLIAYQLKLKYGLTWFADFRDPWTTIGYHKHLKLTSASQKKHKKLENQVLNTADQIIVTSHTTKLEFEALTHQPISVITNGYDIERSSKPNSLDKQFSIAHIGSLLSERNPEILWRVLKELLVEIPEFSTDLQLNFIGFISENILESLEDVGLKPYVNSMGYVSHEEAVMYQRSSQVLLLIEIDSEDTKAIIPGKLFEYMVSDRPIIAMGPEGSDVEAILKETQTGDYFNYQEYKALKSRLITHYQAYKNQALKAEGIGQDQYSRKQLSLKLSQLLLWE